MDKPELEILLATYNGGLYLAEQLDSILSQKTKTSFIVLISDDGSTDNTLEIIDRYVGLDPRVLFIADYEAHRGTIQRFGYLAEKSSAEYVMFCDQDDVWDDSKIEVSMTAIKSVEQENFKEPILIYTDLRVVDKNLRIINPSFMKMKSFRKVFSMNSLLVENSITGCTMLVNRVLLSISLPFPLEAQMHDWWIGLIAKSLGRTVFISQQTLSYRQHSNNVVGAVNTDIRNVLSRLPEILAGENLRKGYESSFAQARALRQRIESKSYHKSEYDLIEKYIKLSVSRGVDMRVSLIRNRFLPYDRKKRIFTLLRLK